MRRDRVENGRATPEKGEERAKEQEDEEDELEAGWVFQCGGV